jgi:lipoprotein signal peptidase
MVSTPDDSGRRLAWRSPAAITLFLVITIAALVGDLWSKHAVFDSLLSAQPTPQLEQRVKDTRTALIRKGAPHASADILRNMQVSRDCPLGVRLTLSTNPGVVFGTPMPRWVVVMTTFITVIAIGAFFAFSPANHRWLHVGKAMILAGAIGNLYDRVATTVSLPGVEPISHQVRDFMNFSAWGYPWIFNIADVWLVVGVVMVMLYWWLHPDHRKTKTESTES